MDKFKYDTTGYKIFTVCNYIILTLLGLLCLFPIIHVLAVSLSGKGYVEANLVTFLPKQINFQSYKYIFTNTAFWRALLRSIERTVLGTIITTFFTILLAYPLSKDSNIFRFRFIYMGLLIVAMLFSGGLVPTYILVANTLHLKDTLWALILPGSVQVFLVIMMMNFMRQLPKSIEEAAYIDGADHFAMLTMITIPCSTTIILTVIMFSFMNQWNSWFDGLIYSSQPQYYPLQTYLQQFLKVEDNLSGMQQGLYTEISENSLACANIIIIMLPIALIYPKIQKYFIKGITLGSVKG